jgi:hypothetical protein
MDAGNDTLDKGGPPDYDPFFVISFDMHPYKPL